MIIETHNLTKKFKDLTAVNNLNLQIKEGEIFGLLGPNGAGKTTTLSMLATLIKPTSGTAKVNGYDIAKEPTKVRKSIGIVFQDPSSDDILTGYENLKLHALLYGISRSKVKSRIKEVLDLVGLWDRKDELVKNYSGGMRRRLELARGLMHEPKILFLDEPTLGLDPQTREVIWNYIEKLVKEHHVTIIITTHYMEEADRLCNRVGIIDFGKIIVLDEPSKLKKAMGGDVVVLKSKTATERKLKELSFIKKIEKKDDSFILTMENANKRLNELFKYIDDIDSVEIRNATLNDVFLHYTGREIREEAGEGGIFNRIAQQSVRR